MSLTIHVFNRLVAVREKDDLLVVAPESAASWGLVKDAKCCNKHEAGTEV